MENFNWTCRYCNQATTITEPNYWISCNAIGTEISIYGNIGISHEAISCPNPSCKRLSLSVDLLTPGRIIHSNWVWGSSFQSWDLLPKSQAKPQPEYIPEQIKNDYQEACSICKLSPKASATLARRCLQGIVRDFWDIPENKRGNLGAEISFIEDKIDPDTWDTIQAIRNVGDIGAHMEKNVNYIVEVHKDEAELLIELIETLLEDWYVTREKRKERNKKTKDLSEKKLKERKAAKNALKENKAEDVEDAENKTS